MNSVINWYRQLPTAGRLFLLLTAAILPLGLVLVVAATTGINQANAAMEARAVDKGNLAFRTIDGLIARNVLALRIAANAASGGEGDPCARARRALAFSPGAPKGFVLKDALGTELCSDGAFDTGERRTLLVPPGQVALWISPEKNRLYYRVGTFGGSATGAIEAEQIRAALEATRADHSGLVLADASGGEIRISGPDTRGNLLDRFQHTPRQFERAIAARQITARATIPTDRIRSLDRLIILLPVLMWIAAALLSWLVVRRFLLQPLRLIARSVAAHEPGSGRLTFPDNLGSAVEVRELADAFVRAMTRIDQSEQDMAIALEGQRKLVREVHHRVKNNLQVVASLLNIHRRSAVSEDAKDAYSSIGRRVDALAVVHRNHYAELEENRGIALRPLVSELASNLRASAPDEWRNIDIHLDLESLHSTQDVAVATAFLTTEVVEHAMLANPQAPITLSLRRTGDHSARFTLATDALSAELSEQPEHQQFERIVGGLAKQLRSSLDKAPGSYSVDLPVFSAR